MLQLSSIGRKAVFVFLLLFLLFTIAPAAHHHDDGKCHNQDCPICAAGILVYSVPSSHVLTTLQYALISVCSHFNDVIIVRPILSPAHALRAPPALSHS